MLIICMAHAKASTKAPRRLTDDGRAHTKDALQRASKYISNLRSGERLLSMRLVSSPACRCLETILMAGEEFGKDFAHLDRCPPGMDRVEIREELLPGHEIRFDLLDITQGKTADLVVIALHGDLAKAVPLRESVLALDNAGFFDAHPVIAILQRKDNDLSLTCVEGLYEGKWQDLRKQEKDANGN
jgi:hypothetical protein